MGMNNCSICLVLGGYLILVITSGSSFCEFFKKSKNIWFWFFAKSKNQRNFGSSSGKLLKTKEPLDPIISTGPLKNQGLSPKSFFKNPSFYGVFFTIF
jgi:hypothetical protein